MKKLLFVALVCCSFGCRSGGALSNTVTVNAVYDGGDLSIGQVQILDVPASEAAVNTKIYAIQKKGESDPQTLEYTSEITDTLKKNAMLYRITEVLK